MEWRITGDPPNDFGWGDMMGGGYSWVEPPTSSVRKCSNWYIGGFSLSMDTLNLQVGNSRVLNTTT